MAEDQPVRTKQPILALILGLLLAGLGAIYNGQTKKGLLILAVGLTLDLFICLLMIMPAFIGDSGSGIGAICCAIPLLMSLGWTFFWAIDAFILAQRMNDGRVIGDMESFWYKQKP